MTQALINLTGLDDPAASWEAIFKYFNQTHYDQSDVGYQAGDKIAIKVNNIFSRSYEWTNSQDNRPCPQMVHALLWQLVNMAGVPEEDITLYDCIFYHGDPVYKYCHADFPGVRWAEGDATDRSGYESGPGKRSPAPGKRWRPIPIVWSILAIRTSFRAAARSACPPLSQKPGISSTSPCRALTNWRVSPSAPRISSARSGIPPSTNTTTVGIRNSCTSQSPPSISPTTFPCAPWNPTMHWSISWAIKTWEAKRCCFWPNVFATGTGRPHPSMAGPPRVLFMSQDGVAIESVLLDFIRSEGAVPAGTPDNYLHEAALADNPPSGTVYDPENDGISLESLGVHEHWNNPVDKQYSRNLGSGEGIELIKILNNTPNCC